MTPFVADPDFTLYVGDARAVLADLPPATVDCCVTSPPYWGLRDYGRDEQLGLEATPDEYVAALVDVFREVWRVLTDVGTLWLNLGDSYASNGPYDDSYEGKRPERAAGYVTRGRDAKYSSRKGYRGAGIKAKDLVGIPWRVAFALQQDGWYLRSDIVWSKPNPMPESVTDRPSKAHEYVFLLAKSTRYYFDQDAVREGYRYDGRHVLDREAGQGSHENHRTNGGKRNRWPGLGAAAAAAARRDTIEGGHVESEPMEITHGGRNVRSVWEIATRPYPEAHFATFPPEIPRRCIAAGCPEGGLVLDPFMGSGTTALVARQLGRRALGIELNPAYAELAAKRLGQQSLLADVGAA